METFWVATSLGADQENKTKDVEILDSLNVVLPDGSEMILPMAKLEMDENEVA